jgi:hypothetical protein
MGDPHRQAEHELGTVGASEPRWQALTFRTRAFAKIADPIADASRGIVDG